MSDNGASAEGGPHGSVNENLFFNKFPESLEDNLKAIDELGGPEHFNHYPWGWAWAGNVPFRRWKRETYVRIENGAEGVLLSQGGSSGGYSFYVKDHRLHYAYNLLGVSQFHVAGTQTIVPGHHELRFEFEPTGAPDLENGKGTPARVQLYVDGELDGEGDLPVTIPLDIGIVEGLACGRDEGSCVTPDYEAPFAFTGELEEVVVDVSGELIEDKAAELRATLAHQ